MVCCGGAAGWRGIMKNKSLQGLYIKEELYGQIDIK